jgi:FkbM family methyltransferase
MIIEAIQKVLRKFGFEIRRTNASLEVFSLQKKLINIKNPIIFDVGASTGPVAANYKEIFPESLIYCFEPFPESYEILIKNIGKDPIIKCYNIALSDKNGKAILNSNKNSATNSLLSFDEKGEEFWGKNLYDTIDTVEVETITLDDFTKNNGITKIDILKLDVQGGEFEILKGASEILSEQKVSLIYSELIVCPTYEGQHKISEYFTLLDSFGYHFLDFFNPIRRHNRLIQSDIIFLNNSLMKNISRT